MPRAISVAWRMSCAAPVEMSPVKSFSAMRPPQQMTIWSRNQLRVWLSTSSFGSAIVAPRARPRGMIVTLWSGSAFGERTCRRAWPASCQAVVSRSFAEKPADLRSRPHSTLSRASSRVCMSTPSSFFRTAISAASLRRFARSAPEKPGVPRATRFTSASFANLIFLPWRRRISSRPLRVGRSTVAWRSKRPGRSRAASSVSGRFVAAMTMTPSLASKPSISTSIVFRVCS